MFRGDTRILISWAPIYVQQNCANENNKVKKQKKFRNIVIK